MSGEASDTICLIHSCFPKRVVQSARRFSEGVFVGEGVSAISFSPLLVPLLSPIGEGPHPGDLLVSRRLDSVQGRAGCERACLQRLVTGCCILAPFSVHW